MRAKTQESAGRQLGHRVLLWVLIRRLVEPTHVACRGILARRTALRMVCWRGYHGRPSRAYHLDYHYWLEEASEDK